MAEQFTFRSFDMDLDPYDREALARELDQVPEEYWYYSAFRRCDLLILYSTSGRFVQKDLVQSQGSLDWSPPSAHTPLLREFAAEKLFPLFKPMGRIAIIRTRPGQNMAVHIDCSKKNFDQMNAKFRLVLRGRIDTLYFFDREGNKTYIRSNNPAYVMDGAHVHAMDNTGDEVKYTLSVGSPWMGEGPINDLLKENGLERLDLSKPDFNPEWEDPLVKEPY